MLLKSSFTMQLIYKFMICLANYGLNTSIVKQDEVLKN